MILTRGILFVLVARAISAILLFTLTLKISIRVKPRHQGKSQSQGEREAQCRSIEMMLKVIMINIWVLLTVLWQVCSTHSEGTLQKKSWTIQSMISIAYSLETWLPTCAKRPKVGMKWRENLKKWIRMGLKLWQLTSSWQSSSTIWLRKLIMNSCSSLCSFCLFSENLWTISIQDS